MCMYMCVCLFVCVYMYMCLETLYSVHVPISNRMIEKLCYSEEHCLCKSFQMSAHISSIWIKAT